MGKINPVREIFKLSSSWSSKDYPEEACPFWSKRMGILSWRREENEIPSVNWRGKGIWEGLRQMMIGEIPNKSMKTVEQRGKG